MLMQIIKDNKAMRDLNRAVAIFLYMHLAFSGFLRQPAWFLNVMRSPIKSYAMGFISLTCMVLIMMEVMRDKSQ